MKKTKEFSPYATFSLEKITAPKSNEKKEPKSRIIKTNKDLRCGRGK